MNEKSIKKPAQSKTDWRQLNSNDDASISYKDSPETTKEFWTDAKVRLPTHKTPVSLRLDDDVIDFFKNSGRGYQTKINEVLKAYVKAHTHR